MMVKTRCDYCGAIEITIASVGRICMFCGKGIMEVVKEVKEGYG